MPHVLTPGGRCDFCDSMIALEQLQARPPIINQILENEIERLHAIQFDLWRLIESLRAPEAPQNLIKNGGKSDGKGK